MPHDVFISHSNVDKPVADAVCNRLESAGVRCWIAPRDIAPGADWSAAIMEAISGSRVLVLIFSAQANGSKHVQREVQRACDRELALIPFRVENVLPTGGMEYYLGSVHWLDALTPPLERHLEKVVEQVRRLVASAVPVSPPVAPAVETATSAPQKNLPIQRDTSRPEPLPSPGKQPAKRISDDPPVPNPNTVRWRTAFLLYSPVIVIAVLLGTLIGHWIMFLLWGYNDGTDIATLILNLLLSAAAFRLVARRSNGNLRATLLVVGLGVVFYQSLVFFIPWWRLFWTGRNSTVAIVLNPIGGGVFLMLGTLIALPFGGWLARIPHKRLPGESFDG